MRAPKPPWQDGLPPVLDAHTRVLVLGSFPGAASLAAQQYYAHPRNQFWPVMAAVLPCPGLATQPYAERLVALQRHGVGLWDVHARCRRSGSLDADIVEAEVNPLETLADRAPHLALIVHNGGESARAMRHTRALAAAVVRLPSTSPAHASWSLARKIDAWAAALQPHLRAAARPPQT